jgi:hypothetical protein
MDDVVKLAQGIPFALWVLQNSKELTKEDSVSVKKPKTPRRLIRYLLYADQGLQKISLRRISVRAKETKKRPRSIRSKNAVRPGDSIRFPWTIHPLAMLLGVICVVAAAALIAARPQSHRADIASVDAPPEEGVMTPRPEMKKTVVSKAPATKTTAAARTSTTPASVETRPTAESVKAMALVTVTGCLELEEETFWLKEASGGDAPKSRSWRSGFLKKRPPSIKLVDATNALRLPSHVGQRVAATGTLMNREIRANSLLRVAASCS